MCEPERLTTDTHHDYLLPRALTRTTFSYTILNKQQSIMAHITHLFINFNLLQAREAIMSFSSNSNYFTVTYSVNYLHSLKFVP